MTIVKNMTIIEKIRRKTAHKEAKNMKKTGRVLTAALAAMMCILPLAACDDEEGSASGSAPEVNGKAFSLADYALDLPDEMSLESKGSVHAEYSTVEEKSFEIETFSGFSDLSIAKEVGTGENSGKYRLYNLEQDTEALPDWYDSINLLSSSPFVSLKKEQIIRCTRNFFGHREAVNLLLRFPENR